MARPALAEVLEARAAHRRRPSARSPPPPPARRTPPDPSSCRRRRPSSLGAALLALHLWQRPPEPRGGDDAAGSATFHWLTKMTRRAFCRGRIGEVRGGGGRRRWWWAEEVLVVAVRAVAARLHRPLRQNLCTRRTRCTVIAFANCEVICVVSNHSFSTPAAFGALTLPPEGVQLHRLAELRAELLVRHLEHALRRVLHVPAPPLRNLRRRVHRALGARAHHASAIGAARAASAAATRHLRPRIASTAARRAPHPQPPSRTWPRGRPPPTESRRRADPPPPRGAQAPPPTASAAARRARQGRGAGARSRRRQRMSRRAPCARGPARRIRRRGARLACACASGVRLALYSSAADRDRCCSSAFSSSVI